MSRYISIMRGALLLADDVIAHSLKGRANVSLYLPMSSLLLPVKPFQLRAKPSALIWAHISPSLPSTLSALRLVAVPALAFTLRGALPEGTLRFSAVAAVEVPLLTSCSTGPATAEVSLVTAPAELALPRRKLPPVAPKAIEATPNMRASTRASPNTIEAVLPTHATLEKT